MNRRLLSPLGGAILFGLLSILVIGGLTWVTLESLRLENQQRCASARADSAQIERLALWRLDSRLFPAMGVENNRLYAHYFPLHTPLSWVCAPNVGINDDPGLLPSPLLMAELPNWMKLHVQLDPETGWDSPQVMSGEIETRFHDQLVDLYEAAPNNLNGNRSQALADLRQHFPANLIHEQLVKLETVNPDDSPLGVPYLFELSTANAPPVNMPWNLNGTTTVLRNSGSVTENFGQAMPPVSAPVAKGANAEKAPATDAKPGAPKSAEVLAPSAPRAATVPPPAPKPASPVVSSGGMAGGRGINPPPSQLQVVPGSYNDRSNTGKNSFDDVRVKTEGGTPAPVMPPPGPAGGTRGDAGQSQQATPTSTTSPADPEKRKETESLKREERKVDAAAALPAGNETLEIAKKGADKQLTDTAKDNAGRDAMTKAKVEPEPQRRQLDEQADGAKFTKSGEKIETLQRSMKQDAGAARIPPAVGKPDANRKALNPNLRPPAVHLGPMRPVWITAPNGEQALMLVRAAKLESKVVFQGVLLDWPRLQSVLLEEVRPQLPEAKLEPVHDNVGEGDRRMTTLPAVLDPGPEPVPPPAGATPLRIGLSLGWLAALLALGATGFVGWTLLDLSERRIRFVSAVTHELRTPLTSLRLYLDLLTSGMIRDEDQQREYLMTLNKESERLNRLIDNVLDFAKLEKRTVQAHCMLTPLHDLIEPVKQAWDERLIGEGRELVVQSTVPVEQCLHTDARMAAQILGNLIDNARKYAASAEDRRIWLRIRPGDSRCLYLEVEDHGPGVPIKERAGIFKPFRRGGSADTTAGGAGLGLALAKQWAEMLNGKLTYRVADGGVGACFRLELPVS